MPTGSTASAGLGDAAGQVTNDHWAWDDGLPIKPTDAFGEATEAFDAWAAGKPSGTYRGLTLALALTLTLTLTPTPAPYPALALALTLARHLPRRSYLRRRVPRAAHRPSDEQCARCTP